MKRSRGLILLYAAPFLIGALWLFLPVISGESTLFLRDTFNAHLEMKWFQAEAMRSGDLPLIDPYRSGGQPHLGNPNSVPLYPDNLLYLLASPIWALNAHFWVHLLLAPLAFFFLGRQLGLSRLASWGAGVLYATSGYYLSTLNLYNLTVPTTLAPAFVAAAMAVSRSATATRSLVAATLLWAGLVLGGDPMTALVVLLIGISAVWLAMPRPLVGVLRLLPPLMLGSLVAGPQLVEFLRIMPNSYRGVQGYSVEAASAASWSPVNLIEWIIPMAFGRPSLLYWGQRFHGSMPLFFSLYPGLITMALAASGTTRRDARVKWCWGLVLVGLFFAMGSFNPVATWTLGLPGMKIIRIPTKLWIMIAIGGSVLAGMGLDALRRGEIRRSLRVALLGLLLLTLLLGLFLVAGSEGVAERIKQEFNPQVPESFATAEVTRWIRLCFTAAGICALALLVVHLGGSAPAVVGGLLIALHVGANLWFLRDLVPMDEVAPYTELSPVFEHIPEDARVVNGDSVELFGPPDIQLSHYPDESLHWYERDVFERAYPVAGITLGKRRYEFAKTPEGLDSFLTESVQQAIQLVDDPHRITFLEASGVTHLLLTRELREVDEERARKVFEMPSREHTLRLYELPLATDEVEFVGRVLRASDPRQAVLFMTDPTFDPRSSVVLAGEGEPILGGRGEASIVESGREELVVRTVATLPGALLVQRSYLPIYAAEIDGAPAEIEVANMHRMAVEVPAGTHEVRIFVQRSTLGPAFLISGLGLVLVGLAVRRRRRAAALTSTPGAATRGSA